MPKQMFATIQLTLSDDQFEAAKQLLDFKPSWDRLLAELAKIGAIQKLEMIETRAKPAAGIGAKRGRKPRAAQADGAQQPANPAALV